MDQILQSIFLPKVNPPWIIRRESEPHKSRNSPFNALKTKRIWVFTDFFWSQEWVHLLLVQNTDVGYVLLKILCSYIRLLVTNFLLFLISISEEPFGPDGHLSISHFYPGLISWIGQCIKIDIWNILKDPFGRVVEFTKVSRPS